MRILFADSNHTVLHETLTSSGFDCDLFWDRSPQELKQLLPQYDGLVIRSRFRVDRDLIDKATRLKCIGRVGAGMENIDVAYASQKNIKCLCVPEGNRDAVGEHAVGMLLMLLNHLKRADDEVRRGIWKRAENRGTEICGKTVGIIGYGHMGTAFAEKLTGFGCRIMAHDKYRRGFGTAQIEETTLEQICREADILSLHLPETEETRDYVNSALIDCFHKPFFLINTARGRCVNTFDLVDGLKSGKIAGACLDVIEYESATFENIETHALPEPWKYLVSSPDVILSPHIAGWTHESNYKMSKLIAEKISAVLKS
jgi:D-3-phosphoglycerate dehydrogenase / 2-oxoglutarate reductase